LTTGAAVTSRRQPGERVERQMEAASLREAVNRLLEVGASEDLRRAAFEIHGVLARIGAERRGK
jgi:hypothetical protein